MGDKTTAGEQTNVPNPPAPPTNGQPAAPQRAKRKLTLEIDDLDTVLERRISPAA
jgi:hypothetical protein